VDLLTSLKKSSVTHHIMPLATFLLWEDPRMEVLMTGRWAFLLTGSVFLRSAIRIAFKGGERRQTRTIYRRRLARVTILSGGLTDVGYEF